MLEIIKKKLNMSVCVKAICDKCAVSVRLESDSNIPSDVVTETRDMKRTPGRHFMHVFGYGTENDSSKLNITLCDNCIAEIFTKYVKIED